MNKLFSCLYSATATLLFCNYSYASFNIPTRASLWAYGGTDVNARGDVMSAILGNEQHILWAGLQGKYGESATWMGSLGIGYRQLYHCERILGAYVYMDDNQSERGNSFLVLSPGIESMGNIWDFRVNSYFPVSSRAKSYQTLWGDEIGINKFISVRGHQQFNHFFDLTEEVGNGVDGEIGCKYSAIKNARIYLGGYYYNIDDNEFTSVSSVRGISGRLEFPMRSHLSLQVVDTYDNLVHNTFIVGMQLSFGGFAANQCQLTLNDRLLDPTSRNLGTTYTGTGIPVVEGKRDQGKNVLERDNIYFFNATSGSVFDPALGAANGTAENPLIGTSFTQATIDAINGFAPGTNFYFTPGTYTLIPAPNGRIALNLGQSMWGRTQDYLLAAQGNNRALFLGGIDLFQGNNRLDSIRLLNNAVGPAEIIALEIENANNVILFNDDIRAIVIAVDLPPTNNLAAGIYGNNSQVIIKDSAIVGTAIVNGTNNGFNAATGIGGNNATGTSNFTNNNYSIGNSIISGNGIVNGDNNLVNFASGIGGNTLFGITNFINNRFMIVNSSILGNATITGVNNLENFATGIGGNYANFLVIGDASFISNDITILSSSVSGVAFVGESNEGSTILRRISPQQNVGNSFNFATGIGGNVRDFNNNIINIVNSDISGSAIITVNNLLENFATGLGGNFGNFVSNAINISNSHIAASALTGNDNDSSNYVAVLGTNVQLATTSFLNNSISIENSILEGIARTGGNNTFENFIVGIGGNYADFEGNNISLIHTGLDVAAIIDGINSGANFATGIGGNQIAGVAVFRDNVINLFDNTLNVTAQVGTNLMAGINQATDIIMNNDGAAATGNIVNIDASTQNILAQVVGLNFGANSVIGLAAIGAGDLINISNSTVNLFAIVAPGSLGTNTITPQLTAGGGTIITTNTIFNLVVSP